MRNDAAEQNCEANQCGERNSNGITQPRGAATPMNCVNPPLAGSRSLAAVILLPRFFSVPNLKAFCTDFVPSNVPRRAAPRFPAPFALCAAVCAFRGWGGVCTRRSPLKRTLRRLCEYDLEPRWKGLSPCRMGRTFSVFRTDQAVIGGNQGSRRSPAKRVRWEEETQRNE